MSDDAMMDPDRQAQAGEGAAPAGAGGRFADYLHRDSKHLAPGAPFAPAIVPTSIYSLASEPSGEYQYARWSNPGWTALEQALGALEQASAVIFPSGAAAVASLLASMLQPGERLLLQSDGYMGTRTAAQRYFASNGVLVETCSTAQVAAHPFDGYRLILLETPSNPGLDLVDIGDSAQRAHAAGAALVIDNTLMTPLGQSPLDLGADAVVYSDTKVLNGHSDLVFGHVASRDPQLLAGVLDWRRICGAIPGPFEAWLLQRGLETLELRLARMHANALALAQALAEHGAAVQVCYPGLPSHPAHALASAQMNGFGALIGLTLADQDAAERFIQGCRYLRPTTSFGGLHSSAERRARWGDAVAAGFIRLSVGCEPTQALRAEVLRSMDQLAPARR
ncbi:putative cystathionine gamma-lyase [Burkholderiales bacterium]|nr:putative cystathionine gamma-lyase [Burkholderiales bacterium]